ncbi:hypothetical protein [uncultured Mediterranean phage uvMED]|nr:hypothetical protein [uncultured Mediterranean phage uvMED]BAR22579.1 hypothetical protein [uncultured Mediterranean phage uvMED]
MARDFKKYFTQSEVIYITSDSIVFYEFQHAKAHADKKGLTVKEFKKPKKKVKNGTE